MRNCTDDTVEVLATGEAETIEALIALCREGPPAARVDRVEVTETDPAPHKDFKQLPTK